MTSTSEKAAPKCVEAHLVTEDGALMDETALIQYIASVVEPSSSSGSHRTERPRRTGSSSSGVTERDLNALRRIGVRYHVVGIFGGQSSGKSTLLNHVFGTKFQMMDETVKRGQTTKGAFLARANCDSAPATTLSGSVSTPLHGGAPQPQHQFIDPTMSGVSKRQIAALTESSTPNASTSSSLNASRADSRKDLSIPAPLFIVDFEGTDGMERGEDQSLERQLSLFALSLADTLIINMWAVDVGRFNAANMSLLRTIFEVNLQLFSHESYLKEEKPTLLVVLRDFTEDDPSHHIETVRKSFDKIWDSISKPEEFADSSIDTLFVLRYFFFPHYKLQREAFDKAVIELRSWFSKPSKASTYLFQSHAMFRGVPLEGLPTYVGSCWDAIRKSKDLDIPTQREMLAQHRCNEAMETALKKYTSVCDLYEDRLNRGEMIVQLSETLEVDLDEQLRDFYSATKLYNAKVVQSYAHRLEKNMVDATIAVLNRYSKRIATEVLSNIDVPLQAAVDECVRRLLKDTQTHIAARKASKKSWTSVGGGGESDAADHGVLAMDAKVCDDLVFNFWNSLAERVTAVLAKVSAEQPDSHIYGRFVTLVSQDHTAHENVVQLVTDTALQKIRSRISSMAENACDTMHRGFEYTLTHQADGTTRFFSTTTGLQQAYPSAQHAGLVLLGCLFYFRLKIVKGTEAALLGEEDDDVELEDSDDDEIGGSASRRSQGRTSRTVRGSASSRILAKSRTGSRLNRNRRAIRVRSSVPESQFFLAFESVDVPPLYPPVPTTAYTNAAPASPTAAIGGETSEGENSAVDNVDGAEPPVEINALDDDVDAENIFMTKAAVQRAFDLYQQRCDFTFQLQLRSIESGKQNLPAWVIPALFLLGWNEMWYVFTSPLLLCFILLVSVVFFKNLIIAKWHAFEETGPPGVVIAVKTIIAKVEPIYTQLVALQAADTPSVGGDAESPISSLPESGSKPIQPVSPSKGTERATTSREKPAPPIVVAQPKPSTSTSSSSTYGHSEGIRQRHAKREETTKPADGKPKESK